MAPTSVKARVKITGEHTQVLHIIRIPQPAQLNNMMPRRVRDSLVLRRPRHRMNELRHLHPQVSPTSQPFSKAPSLTIHPAAPNVHLICLLMTLVR